METPPPNIPQAVVLLCIFCVRCRPRDRPAAEKSEAAVGLHTQIFQKHLLALLWHHEFPRAAQTSPRLDSWSQGGWCGTRGAQWMGSSGDVGTSEKVTPRCDDRSGYLGHSRGVFYPSVCAHLWGGLLPGEVGKRPQPTLLAHRLSRCIPSRGAQQLLSMSRQGARDTILGSHIGAH